MQMKFLRIWESGRKTILFVTNNIEEAFIWGRRFLSKMSATVKQILRDRPVQTPGHGFRGVPEAEEQISDNMGFVRDLVTKESV